LAYPLEVDDGQYGRIHWVIVGGESGTNARPMHPDWVRSIRDQCVAAGVPFFFKQWGEWTPDTPNGYRLENVALWNYKDADEWIYLRDLQPDRRENWNEHEVGDVRMYKVGKKNAGRVLDGRTWDEVPR
jgi:protein gp37